jgi:hypothetical protein
MKTFLDPDLGSGIKHPRSATLFYSIGNPTGTGTGPVYDIQCCGSENVSFRITDHNFFLSWILHKKRNEK